VSSKLKKNAKVLKVFWLEKLRRSILSKSKVVDEYFSYESEFYLFLVEPLLRKS
jgi:hypothetical protein